MTNLNMVKHFYYIGNESKELETNNWPTVDEALYEAKRIASKLNHPIPVFLY